MARSLEDPFDDEERRWREWDQYEAQQAVLMTEARKEREAHEAAVARAYVAEISRPASQRAYFSIDEIAAALARPDGSAKPECQEREHICQLLMGRAHRGDLFDAEGKVGVFTLIGEVPFFVAYQPAPLSDDAVLVIFLLDSAETFLSRSALFRFLREAALRGANRLIKEWSLDAKPTRSRSERAYWRLAQEEAFKYLLDEGEPAGRGDKAKLQQHIAGFLAGRYDEHPAKSTLQRHTNQWIAEFAALKAQATDK